MSGRLQIGIVGAGRFGRALSVRLAHSVDLLIADEAPEKAVALAGLTGGRAASLPEVFKDSDVVMLVVPPGQTALLAEQYSQDMRAGALLLNLATSVPTSEVQQRVKRRDIQVLGVKPIAQAHAVEHGCKAVFVVTGSDVSQIMRVSEILRPIGPCIAGDEMLVRHINASATRAALKMIMEMWEDLSPICPTEEVLNVAIQTVAVGTIQDFPPREPNDYISEQLKVVLTTRNLEGQQ